MTGHTRMEAAHTALVPVGRSRPVRPPSRPRGFRMADSNQALSPAIEPVVDRAGVEHAPRPPAAGIALCLSGGGYRAMLFHVGALLRIKELGLLPKINWFSSVSGGSITA